MIGVDVSAGDEVFVQLAKVASRKRRTIKFIMIYRSLPLIGLPPASF